MDLLNITMLIMALVVFSKYPWQATEVLDKLYTGPRQSLDWPYEHTKE